MALTTELAPALAKPRRAVRRRPTRRPRIATVVGVLGLAWFTVEGYLSLGDLASGPGGFATALGTLLAMVGTYLAALVLVLASRLPWLERSMGHDKMIGWHRKLAPYSLFIIGGHVLFTTLGYSQRRGVSLVDRFLDLVLNFPWMLPALVGFVLMVALGVSSYRRVRSKVKYETWSTSHLYFYVAVIISFGHQIESSSALASLPALKFSWIALFAGVASALIYGRVIRPVVFSLRHQLRVDRVVEEAAGTYSVYLTGRNLAKVSALGGQFFMWRFATRDWWWQAHPYSLSAAPNDEWLRITVKALGDQSGSLASLRPGTRVFAEGPYGVFTSASLTGERVALFAAGVGITPVRAILETLDPELDVTVVYRAMDESQAALANEISLITEEHGWQFHLLFGGPEAHPLTWDYYQTLLPELPSSDVYICGPAGFTAAVTKLSTAVGVPSRRLHHEAFAF